MCCSLAEAEAFDHFLEVHYNGGAHFGQVVHCVVLPEGFPNARSAGDDEIAWACIQILACKCLTCVAWSLLNSIRKPKGLREDMHALSNTKFHRSL